MSKGYGKIERAILQCLNRKQRAQTTSFIVICVFYPERFDEVGDIMHTSPTPTQYKSILRALASLESKGLIKSERLTHEKRLDNRTWSKQYVLTP